MSTDTNLMGAACALGECVYRVSPGSTGEVLSEYRLSHGDGWRPRELHTLPLAPQNPHSGSLCFLPVQVRPGG